MAFTMFVGQTCPNTIAFFDKDGKLTTVIDAPAVYKVTDATVITIDPSTGLVTAIAPGTTSYDASATAGGANVSIPSVQVTVLPAPPGPAVTGVITPGTPV